MIKICIDIEQLTALLKQGLSTQEISHRMGVKRSLVQKRMRQHGLKSSFKLKMTVEQRKKISTARLKWNRENPERLRELMISRACNKNRSVPCELLKEWLRNEGIQFVEEFQPLRHRGRYFSIDIAFPDRKIGIEVNGNQHYESDGRLRPRYQERHDLIVKEGWILHEWHYPICFKPEIFAEAVRLMLSSATTASFDYGTYQPPKGRQRKHPKGDNSWRRSPRPGSRKCIRPSAEELRAMIWSTPVSQLSALLGLSKNAVRRWCEEYGLETPPCRYWPRRKAGMSHEEALLPVQLSEPRHIITPEILAQIKHLREQGGKWTAIGRAVGFDRHTVKEAYVKMARTTGLEPA